jgi:Tfp pilus assembly protein PilN
MARTPTYTPEPVSALPLGAPARFVTVRAHLMPAEVIARRRVGAMKRQVTVALAVLLLAVLGWFSAVVWTTHNAKTQLAAAQSHTTALQQEQRQFAPLIAMQSNAATINNELTQLMVGDLRWNAMLETLRRLGGSRILLTSVNGTITSGAGSQTQGQAGGTTGIDHLNTSGSPEVGTLTIQGSAPDKDTVAAFVDALTGVTGLNSPLVASVSGAAGHLTFTVNVLVTKQALGGRYAAQRTGGK